jgi:threonylcarbamoyladenosine tRNA methylthiotransferase CDKAL1
VEEGQREFWITGDDVGSYGLDLGSNLPELLAALRESDLDIRVLLGNVNPRWITEYLDDLAAFFESPMARKWLFIPVQSGNNDVLRSMGRKYTIESCVDIIRRLQGIEKMKYHYDLMVAFPTETDEAFADTVDFVLHYPPSSVMLATYSPEDGTAAYDLEPLPKDVARDRMHRLNMACAAAQGILSKKDPGLVREFGT